MTTQTILKPTFKKMFTPEQKVKYAEAILTLDLSKGKPYTGPCIKTSEGLASMQLYPHSNENLSFLKELRPQGKYCLTVGSSLDQALTLMSLGATRVDVFDINPYTDSFFELKKQAILHLNQAYARAFLTYHPGQKLFLDESLYKNFVREHLEESEKELWDKIISSPNKLNMFRTDDFRQCTPEYLVDSKLFKTLRGVLKNRTVNFYNTALSTASGIERQYDIILLSNVGDWYKTKERYIRDVDNLARIIYPDSLIQVGYTWNADAPRDTEKAIKNAYGKAIKEISVRRSMASGRAQILDMREYGKIHRKKQETKESVASEDD